jgi:hypothetical protein
VPHLAITLTHTLKDNNSSYIISYTTNFNNMLFTRPFIIIDWAYLLSSNQLLNMSILQLATTSLDSGLNSFIESGMFGDC